MAGLLDGVLPYLYSQGNRLKRNVNGLLSDPVGTFQQTAGQVGDNHNKLMGLLGQAFPDPKQPFKAQNKNALMGAVDMAMNGPLGFAPVGMTAAIKSLPTQAEKMKAVGYEGGWYRGGPKIENGKMSGPWYTRAEDEAADYARRFGANAEVREYALPKSNMIDANMGYSGRLAHDLAGKVDNTKLADMLRSYDPAQQVSGVEIWQGLKNNIGEDAAMDALRKLGFGGVKGINSPDYVRLFPGTVARDAKKAAFDPAKIKGRVDDIYGFATPGMLAAVAGTGALGLAALRSSRGDE